MNCLTEYHIWQLAKLLRPSLHKQHELISFFVDFPRSVMEHHFDLNFKHLGEGRDVASIQHARHLSVKGSSTPWSKLLFLRVEGSCSNRAFFYRAPLHFLCFPSSAKIFLVKKCLITSLTSWNVAEDNFHSFTFHRGRDEWI